MLSGYSRTLFRLFAGLAFLLLTGCAERAPHSTTDLFMDTFVRIRIDDSIKKREKDEAARAAIARMRDLEKKFDYFSKTSEIGRINLLKKGEALTVSDDTIDLLLLCERMEELTLGAFDITFSSGTADNRAAGWKVDPGSKIIFIYSDGVKLNPGGIAKGFIVDKGVEILKARNVKNAFINAGGDIYCLGSGSGKGWRVGINDPQKPGNIIARLAVRDRGVATSGGYERPGHIIDPATARPVKSAFKSVTVIAESCAVADGLATAFYVLSPEEAVRMADSMPEAECVIIDEGGTFRASKGAGQFDLTKTLQ